MEFNMFCKDVQLYGKIFAETTQCSLGRFSYSGGRFHDEEN